MRKIALCLTMTLLLAGYASALRAQGLYVQVNGAFAVQAVPSVIEFRDYADSTGYTESQNIYATQGGGVFGGIDLGYMLNPTFGVEMGFHYHSSTTIEAKNLENPFLKLQAQARTRQGRLCPGIRLSTDRDKLNAFVRTGLVVPIFGATYLDVTSENALSGSRRIGRSKDLGSFSVGMYGGLGGEYRLGDHLSLTGELQFIHLQIKALSRTLYELTDLDTGQDYLAGLNEKDIVTNYYTELDSDSNNSMNGPLDPERPTEEYTYTSNYSNLALKLGIKFSF